VGRRDAVAAGHGAGHGSIATERADDRGGGKARAVYPDGCGVPDGALGLGLQLRNLAERAVGPTDRPSGTAFPLVIARRGTYRPSIGDGQDLYRTLQVDSEADVDVIRAAYRVLAARNHPDVGGSSEKMSVINQAWNTLSNPIARSAYDRERRIRTNGEKWDAYGSGPNAARDRSTGTILEFGRYAGWTIAEVARRDPDYLEWLARTLIGRRYRAEIDEILTKLYPVPAAPPAQRRRSRFARA
jgi:hypothetical protein